MIKKHLKSVVFALFAQKICIFFGLYVIFIYF